MKTSKAKPGVSSSQGLAPGRDCIEWKGAVSKFGYGVLKIGGRKGLVLYAHRLAYRLYSGEIPDGKFVCHRCDNPPCINPKHLFLGTASINNLDAWGKGRMKAPPTRFGEHNPVAKLKNNEVIKIWENLQAGQKGIYLARKFKVSPQIISAIKRGRTYKCVLNLYPSNA